MKKLFTISICTLILVTSSAIGQPIKPTVTGNSEFAFELFKEVFKNDSNVFFSPYSISSALAMTYAGAENETEKQMSKVLHYDLNQLNTHQGFFDLNAALEKTSNDSTIKLSIASALWKSESLSLKKEFLELTQKYYNASIFPLTGAGPINEWADQKTNGKIKEIVKDKDLNEARLVLTNAIYFKGDWLSSFDEKNTKKAKFRTGKDKEVDVDMMFQVCQTKYFEDEQYQILELPYKDETVSMTIILPKGSSSIDTLAKNIDNSLMSFYNSELSKQKVNIYLPKFSLTSEFHLEYVLPKMGMPDAFDEIKSDFTGMSSERLYIGSIIHKAFIEVNEKGSEAAAVTAVIMNGRSAQREITFNANRPFMILIRDKATNTILFMGSVINPTEGNDRQ